MVRAGDPGYPYFWNETCGRMLKDRAMIEAFWMVKPNLDRSAARALASLSAEGARPCKDALIQASSV